MLHLCGGKWLITGNGILIIQSVPALNPLVLVLQTLIPVLQPLSFGSDTQLTATCQGGSEEREAGVGEQAAIVLSIHQSNIYIYQCSRWISQYRSPTQR